MLQALSISLISTQITINIQTVMNKQPAIPKANCQQLSNGNGHSDGQ
jgi:hypothetical protein